METSTRLTQDVKKLVKLVERMQGESGQNVYKCFTTFIDVSLEALRRAKVRDLAWKPELGVFEPAYDTLCRMVAVLFDQLLPEIC